MGNFHPTSDPVGTLENLSGKKNPKKLDLFSEEWYKEKGFSDSSELPGLKRNLNK
ncbi:hypothetical protein NG799_22615 [Laspinema sp. D1]|uniref:Uncharacterized protein n=1 Tax=Laspinema palackyanum D2a TaxID=2953684 RepID=A0ABT2N061_9CYAN|nr:hypothetical protein [Laspinema sp. D2b]MCT7969111.1 hypothetical protein [Laspinema sp. D2a]